MYQESERTATNGGKRAVRGAFTSLLAKKEREENRSVQWKRATKKGGFLRGEDPILPGGMKSGQTVRMGAREEEGNP